MTTMTTRVSGKPAAAKRSGVRAMADRWFFTGSAVLMLALVLVGFHHFYFEGRAYPGRPITPPIRTLVIVHGVSMMAWLLFFIVQPLLVAVRKRKVHMMVGMVGVVVAAIAAVTGVIVSVRSAQVTPPDMLVWGLNPVDFMSVPMLAVALFSAFIGAAVWKRKKPAMHRAFMFTATITAVDAGLSRIDAFANLYTGTVFDTVFSAFFPTLVLGVILIAARAMITRSIDRWMVVGLSIVAAAVALTMLAVRTGVWGQLVGPLVV